MASRTAAQTFANGQVDTYGYDNRNRQTSVTHANSTGGTISSESYVYDGAGNLSSKTIGSGTTSYTYDNADQLLTETAPSYSESFTYDANGNRATANVGAVAQTYNVDNADKLTSITSGSTTLKSYTYDAAGRTKTVVTSAGTTTLAYDYEDRITGITYPSSATDSFTYNGLDTRVSKVDSTGSYSFVRDGTDVTDPVLDDGVANYTAGVSRHTSSGTTFDNLDRLGASNLQTNASQSTTATRTYDAFGMLVATTGAPVGPFGFVGKQGYQEDADSALKLLGHRYYDPSTGRFLTRDPAKDGRNWYLYCNSDPTAEFDRSGLQEEAAMATAIAWDILDPEPTTKILLGTGIVVMWLGSILYSRVNIKDNDDDGDKEHKKNKRKSTRDEHQKGQGRKKLDKRNEKGDDRRPY